jgi:alkanesulfonate monooxygenase SsuD/methylene tetrahydromethanopterin reductase-like flavin-dependent oxidoreductase (luciferase family)
MELGIHFINFNLAGGPQALGPTMAATARAAEQGGATMFTLADHFFQMDNLLAAEDPFLEGYTSMGFLAAQTDKITLSMLVTGVTYRYPGALAKTVTTFDVLSQGRSMLGIGAAWYEREHVGLGIPSRRSASGSRCWKRRCRSASKCGATTTGPSRASTTGSPKHFVSHSRFNSRGLRS